MHSLNDAKALEERISITHISTSVTDSTDQSFSSACSRNILSSGITTPTITSTILRNIHDSYIGSSLIEPPLEYQHQARFLPPPVSFSSSTKEGSFRADCKYLSHQQLDSQQSSETSVTSRFSRSGQSSDKFPLKNDKCYSTVDLSSRISVAATSKVKNIETLCSELRSLLLDNQCKESFDSPLVHDHSYSSYQSLNSLGLSSKGTDNSESLTTGGSDCNESIKDQECSHVGGLISGVNPAEVSTILKNIETLCSHLRSLLSDNQDKGSLESTVISQYYFPKQGNNWLVDDISSSRKLLESVLLTPESNNNSEFLKTQVSGGDQSIKNNKCSKIDNLHCGNVTHITPTVTATTLKNIVDSFTGKNLNDPLFKHEHKTRFVSPSVPYLHLPIQDSHRFGGRMCSSDDKRLESAQKSSESSDNSKPSKTGQTCISELVKHLIRNEKKSRIDILACSSATHPTPTITSATLKYIYDPFIELNHFKAPENQHQARFVVPAVPFSYHTKQDNRTADNRLHSSQTTDSTHQSSRLSVASRSSISDQTGEENHLINVRCSNIDCLTRDDTSFTTSTLTSTTLKNVEEPFMNFCSVEPPPIEHEHQARFLPPVIPFSCISKQEDNPKKDDHIDPSDPSLDSPQSSTAFVLTSNTSKIDKSRTKHSSKDKIRRA